MDQLCNKWQKCQLTYLRMESVDIYFDDDFDDLEKEIKYSSCKGVIEKTNVC